MNYAEYVDTSIGTVGDEKATSLHGGGKTHPGACLPGGMVQLSPDTVTGGDNGTGYNWCQNTIEGFSFNHLSGIGWYGDLGNLQIMPVVGETGLRSGSNEFFPLKKSAEGWKSPFTHDTEITKAGYYAVRLDRYDLFAEATVTPHTGLLRITYPESDSAGLLLNLPRRIAGRSDMQQLTITDSTHFEGFIRCTPKGGGFGRGRGGIRYTLYFSCELSRPFDSCRFFSDEEYLDEGLASLEGPDVGLALRFRTQPDEQITLRAGISYVDTEGARNNLRAEAEGLGFDAARENALAAWNRALSVISAEGADETDRTIFYTCLYHALLDPRIYTDADGRFTGADGQIHRTDKFTCRTVFSGWDVYRSEFPLLTLIAPRTVSDEINSLISIAHGTSSAFPRWELMGVDSGCMLGDPGVIVLADAYVKGIRSYDADAAYDVARAGCLGDTQLNGKPFSPIRKNAPLLADPGWNPIGLSETLEELLADFTLSRMAEAMGRADDAALFHARSRNYARSFNPSTGFMGPRAADGTFLPVRDEYDTKGCTESNIFQQSFFVPWDVKGLSRLFGEERFRALLERLFAGADLTALWNEDYNHSNEPCHNLTHYFNLIGCPERTQYWTRRVQKEAYRTGAFGFCGNEDVGQLSAWYVLSALGLAQVCPAVPEYQLNTPLFRRAVLQLDPAYHACTVSDAFTVLCDRDPLEFPYIESVRLNGTPLDRLFLTHSEITSGGTLEIRLKEHP